MDSAKNIYKIILLLCGLLLSGLSMALKADDLSQYSDVLSKCPDDGEALKEAAFYYLSIGDYAQAEKHARRLIELGESIGDRDFCGLYGMIVLGASMLDDNPDKSFALLEEARLRAMAVSNHDALLSINNSLGVYYLLVHNDVYTATSYYYEALENAKAINDQRRYGIILSNLSGAYLMMNDVSGQKLAEQSHELALKRGEDIPLYYAKLALAQFYVLADSLGKVDDLIREIEAIRQKGSYDSGSNLYLLKGRVAEKRGRLADAYRNYHLAMDVSDGSDVSEIQAVNLAYARLLRRENKIYDAVKVLEKRLEANDSTEMKIYYPEIVKELVCNYKELGDYRKALEYSLSYQASLDSIFNISRERALQENRIRHEIFTNERLIDEQRIELLSSRHKLALLAISVVAMLLLLTFTYISYRKKDKLYKAIVSQNKEHLAREQILQEQIGNSKRREAHADVAQPSADREKSDDLLARFVSLMMEEKVFCDPSITVGGVAEMLGTNRTYLSKAINGSMKKTFTQVVNDYRIREAIALISDLDANRPLKQICSDVGFSSLSTFYSSFQAVTGMTPARYRAHLISMS